MVLSASAWTPTVRSLGSSSLRNEKTQLNQTDDSEKHFQTRKCAVPEKNFLLQNNFLVNKASELFLKILLCQCLQEHGENVMQVKRLRACNENIQLKISVMKLSDATPGEKIHRQRLPYHQDIYQEKVENILYFRIILIDLLLNYACFCRIDT